jgi:voltage-gated potassium channel
MTLTDDEIAPQRVQTYDSLHVDDLYAQSHEGSALLQDNAALRKSSKFFQNMSLRWVPGQVEGQGYNISNYHLSRRRKGSRRNSIQEDDDDDDDPVLGNGSSSRNNLQGTERHRSLRRRFFLFLTEPDTSLGSAAFFFVLILAISVSNIIMMVQTMQSFQYTPTDCHICGGETTYMFDDDLGNIPQHSARPCQCPPEPFPYLQVTVDYLLYFFAVEWTLRVLSFVDADPSSSVCGQFGQWLGYLASTSTLIDALAIWPYFFESLPKGLVSLRLLRLFRVFQLVRLGQYNVMFLSLTNVLQKSLEYLRILVLVLLFGAAIFGSLLYWLEQGTWKYWEPTGDFQYIRMSVDGVNEEISPFRSIPVSFWWFLVTATTVGYGDYYPTSPAGQWVAAFAMLAGVLVIAFPVSVFSDLWSEELKGVKGFDELDDEEDDYDDDEEDDAVHDLASSMNAERQRPRNNLLFDNAELENLSKDPRYVVMEKKDLKEIVSSLRTIGQEQRRIKRLLKKYRHNEG